MGAKTGAKSNRMLKQNGKGKLQEKQEGAVEPDLSVLRKPVEISVPGLNEVVKVFQSSTPELRHLLSYECDVVYECKVCRNLFRSLLNFISHKRVYCTQLYSDTQQNLHKRTKNVDDTTVFVQPEPVRNTRSRESWLTSDSVGETEEQETYQSKTRNGQAQPAPFRITIKKDLTSIVEKLMQKNTTQTLTEMVGHVSSASEFYDGVSKELDVRRKEAKTHTVHLEPMDNTSYGVFQTIIQTTRPDTELIKSQVQDLQRIMSDTEAVLGPDGRVVENGISQRVPLVLPEDRKRKPRPLNESEYNGPPVTAPESEVELYCNLCKKDFPSFKSLNHHMKSLHMTFRTFYPCPCCKLPLSNSWSVYRHLLKAHRKTNEQIRKLREKVMRRSFRKEVLQSGAQKLSKPNASENPLCPNEVIYDTSFNQPPQSQEENDKHWFGHNEDGPDMQCCGGCGRRFERRAALLAHSQSCSKLLAAKQSNANAGRTPSQSVKSAALGRPPNQLNKLANAVRPSVVPALRSSTCLPLNPLKQKESGHLSINQMENNAPAKKIQIEVRRDYGKTLSTNNESRARTTSTSRSDEGPVSLGRSDDGMTSGSSETEITGAHDQTGDVKKQSGNCRTLELDDSVRMRSLKSLHLERNDSALYRTDKESVTKRGIGRPPKPKLHVNGLDLNKQVSNCSDEYSDDSVSNDVEEDIKPSVSRKRKAVVDDADCEEKDSLLVASHSGTIPEQSIVLQRSDNESKMAALSNVQKLQCLTCRKKYTSLGNLRRHVAVHIGWNRFRCIVCGFKCFSKCDCIAHALNTHLEPWEKEKAVAMVQDIQMDAGGSTDTQPCDGLADSGDSESASSDTGSPVATPDKSASCVNTFDEMETEQAEQVSSTVIEHMSTSESLVSPMVIPKSETSAVEESCEIIGVA